jgi:hypothetical protein
VPATAGTRLNATSMAGTIHSERREDVVAFMVIA